MPKKKKEVERKPLLNFRSNMCTNPELSDRFADEVLRITGLEVDDEGYIVDTEEDPFEPDYIFVKGKMLRRTNQGLLFANDIIFDPYNNTVIIEELLRQYIQKYHPEISTYNIFVTEKNIEGFSLAKAFFNSSNTLSLESVLSSLFIDFISFIVSTSTLNSN